MILLVLCRQREIGGGGGGGEHIRNPPTL